MSKASKKAWNKHILQWMKENKKKQDYQNNKLYQEAKNDKKQNNL